MASLYPSLLPLSITAYNGASRTSPLCPFLTRNHKSKASKVTKPSQYYVSRVSCKATKDGSNDTEEPINDDVGMFDRRNMLIGLGAGLYGTAAILNNESLSLADPIAAPDLSNCQEAHPEMGDPLNCCPQISEPVDFEFPLNPKVKVRPAAHKVVDDKTYIQNYEEAIRRMKALSDDDPRSFTQQAKIHCAYCEGAYQQPGTIDPKLVIDVHYSWLFFPFHRWYIYFFERILASLIPDLDPNFRLPFWSWDSPEGMQIPPFYAQPSSLLFDPLRNLNHVPPKIIDLNFNGTDKDIPDDELIQTNIDTVCSQVVNGSGTTTLFFGEAYHAGCTKDPGAGAVEQGVHNEVHFWTGRLFPPFGITNGEDMANFYSAGRDPIFYAHHANVDRMWTIWKSRGGKDIEDTDWLDAEFVFYDETAKLVRVKVRDCLDTEKLGYVYQDIDIPWLDCPKTVPPASKRKTGAGEGTKFPLVLDSIVSTVVKRPKKSRSKEEKEEEEEVLVIEGIEFEGHLGVKFDVHINDDEHNLGGPMTTEFVGSFLHLPHREHKDGKDSKMKTKHRFGISKLLKDLRGEDDEDVLVTLVPKFGSVTIGGIKIELEKRS